MRSSSPATILKEITSKAIAPSCVVITSPDRIRRERALRYLIEHFIADKKNSPLSFAFSESGRSSPAQFLRDLEEPSLFEPIRFGIIRSIEAAKAADVEPVSRFISKGIAGAHLFIVGESLPNTPNFKKSLLSHATHLAFEPLKGAELSRWVEREAKQNGLANTEDEVIELLISLGGDNPEAISQLLEKFTLYLGGERPTKSALRALEPGRASASDFELAEALLSANRGATETLLSQLISQGSSPFMLIGLLTKTFSTLLRIRSLSDRGLSQNEIRADLNISPWLFSKYLPLAKRRSSEALSRDLEALMIADFRLKDRSLGPAVLLSEIAKQTSRVGR